jgi:uncharacterized membrane protein YfcA
LDWPAYLALGALAGLLAGLFGVGGGLIVVPGLLYIFHAQGVAESVALHLALGTSLASIVLTSMSSLASHHRHGAVDWALVGRITPGLIIGTLFGAQLAGMIDAAPLKLFFIAFLLFAATQMWLEYRPAPHRQPPGPVGMSGAGGIVGAVSALVGIGGGTLTVPFQLWCNVSLHRAIGSSAAMGLPIAAAGAVGYVIAGWAEPARPETSLGFIHLPSLGAIAASSVLAAPLGAFAAHRLPVSKLKKYFALLLYSLAARMLWDVLT